jgi:spermidine synthase
MTERRLVLLAIGTLGLSAVVTQLALMRELLSAFHGNELALGTTLGAWLFLTGLGAWLGRASWLEGSVAGWLSFGLVPIALLPLGEVLAVRGLRDVIFIRGAEVGYLATALSSFLVLMPYCLVSGFMLTRACGLGTPPACLSDHGRPTAEQAARPENAIGSVYVADSLGSIVGGLLFSFVLVHFLDHVALLAVPAFLSLAVAILIGWRMNLKWATGLAAFTAVGLALLLWWTDPDAASTAWQYPQQTVVFRGNSPYGRLVVTDQDGQLNFLENGVPLFSSRQTEQAEETIHYALAQRPSARQVLLIGGGFSGAVTEILKYGPQAVTYVEFDRLITRTGNRFLPSALADPRVQTLNTDGRLWLKQGHTRLDVIVVNVPDPSTSTLNRFYTVEFLREAKRRLSRDGVLCFGLGHYENFVSPGLARMLATAYHTASAVFTNVLMIPGGRVYFIASDGSLTNEIASQLEQRRIPTQWVNRHYLEATLTPDRLLDLRHAVDQPSRLNSDFSPILYFHHLRHWLSQFDYHPGTGLAVLGVLLVIFVGRLRAPGLAICASGFAASALEVVLLLTFQALYGSLYQQLGLVVTVFMAGLATGAFASRGTGLGVTNRSPRRKLAWLAFSLAALAWLLPLSLRALAQWESAGSSSLLPRTAIFIMTFLVALLVGMEFPVAGRIGSRSTTETASRLYAADFVGAGLGALAASAWLIPVLGMGWTCLIAGMLNALGGAALLCAKENS